MSLALDPLISSINKEKENKDSFLAQALSKAEDEIDKISKAYEKNFDQISNKIDQNVKAIFPALGVKLNISRANMAPKIDDVIKKGSGLRISEGTAKNLLLEQQGTGARRALFWSMIEVHNSLEREKQNKEADKKELEKLRKKANKKEVDNKRLDILEGRVADETSNEPALPGYLLLIDEPENALHPIAARAAQRQLYELARQPDWQVMITTHSPYFINPFEDHTTIVRLDKSFSDDSQAITHKTYISDEITFSHDEKANLKALQSLDPSLAEIFFGSYPIIVEGDTEHAAFIAAIISEDHPLQNDVTIIRARGKAIIPSLIQMMRHFKVDFGLLHDCDAPQTKDKKTRGCSS